MKLWLNVEYCRGSGKKKRPWQKTELSIAVEVFLKEFKSISRADTHPEEVSVAIVEQPVMHHNVPGAIVVGERSRVPPVLTIA